MTREIQPPPTQQRLVRACTRASLRGCKEVFEGLSESARWSENVPGELIYLRVLMIRLAERVILLARFYAAAKVDVIGEKSQSETRELYSVTVTFVFKQFYMHVDMNIVFINFLKNGSSN